MFILRREMYTQRMSETNETEFVMITLLWGTFHNTVYIYCTLTFLWIFQYCITQPTPHNKREDIVNISILYNTGNPSQYYMYTHETYRRFSLPYYTGSPSQYCMYTHKHVVDFHYRITQGTHQSTVCIHTKHVVDFHYRITQGTRHSTVGTHTQRYCKFSLPYYTGYPSQYCMYTHKDIVDFHYRITQGAPHSIVCTHTNML